MSLRLLLDEDIQSHDLVGLLREAGHDVLTVNEAGLRGRNDERILAAAIGMNRIVMTFNADDFRDLHRADSNHSGIIAVYRHRQRSSDLTPSESFTHFPISRPPSGYLQDSS